MNLVRTLFQLAIITLILACVLAVAHGQIMFAVDGELLRPPFNIDQYAALVKLLDEFDRKMAGCPSPHYTPGEICQAGAGVLDLKLLKKIQTLAPEALALPVAKGRPPGNAKGSRPRE